jgi:hypothetical protein
MGPVKLIERAAGTAIHAVRHPVSSAAYAAGIARGLAGAVLHGVTATGHDSDAGPSTTQRDTPSTGTPSATSTAPTEPTAATATTSGPPEPQRVMKPVPEPGDLPEPIVIEPTDEEPGESFATEPKAVSRESAHGGTDLLDAEIDDWEEEAQDGLDVVPDVDVETPVGTTGAGVGHNPDTAEADLQQPGTPPLLDPSVAKAIRSESEILRKAAEPDPSEG